MCNYPFYFNLDAFKILLSVGNMGGDKARWQIVDIPKPVCRQTTPKKKTLGTPKDAQEVP
jgi:hypothetical protein